MNSKGYAQDKGQSLLQSRNDTLETPLLLSIPEAAHLLGVGVTFTWIMVRRGELPTVKLGRRVLVPRIALEQLASMNVNPSEQSTT